MKKIFKKINELFIKEKNDFPKWWDELTIFRKLSPAIFCIFYLSTLFLLKGLRIDHFFVMAIFILLSYLGRFASQILNFLLPIILTGIVYDSQRHFADFIRGEIHVKFPYEFDKKYFGINTEILKDGVIETVRLTPNEFLALHIHPLLDLITGFFYLFFISIYVCICIYHAFFLKTFPNHPLKKRVTWAFFSPY